MRNIYILGIESSCDETAASVVKNGREVISNVISSQIDLHTLYGGVVPEIASRKHVENINYVVKQALHEAADELSLAAGPGADTGSAKDLLSGIDAVAVTYGPGLVGALLVGVAEAKAIAYAANKPLVPVHHIAGHVAAVYLEHPDLKPPFLSLIVSGGHTNLAVTEDYNKFRIIGTTRDDAAGEAYDKVARSIGLGYPGGPKIDKAAKQGNADAIAFPKAKVEGAPYDFSFSGLKSAVLNYQNHAKMMGEEVNNIDLAASFQKAVVEVLVEHTIDAAREFGYRTVTMAGGVSANSALRAAMKSACEENGIELYVPSPIYCTDNAAMIACAGYYEYMTGVRAGTDLNAVPGLSL